MKETSELFKEAELLRDFSNQSLSELILLRDELDNFIRQVTVAKRDAIYFSEAPEQSYRSYREACYEEIYANGEVDVDFPTLSETTQNNINTLSMKLKNIDEE